uniref:Uncharacterized protein n=1 Tax=Arsenophonus endosymbiont of Trialeurodes vaporariorum TaxID=235567 RepID=A0A3B0MKG5_9GAMM
MEGKAAEVLRVWVSYVEMGVFIRLVWWEGNKKPSGEGWAGELCG